MWEVALNLVCIGALGLWFWLLWTTPSSDVED
jgi:hypothetical protein